MGRHKEGAESAHTLRKRAEALIQAKDKDIPHMSPVEIRELVYELDTHQIELEMQNEELRKTQAELLDTHERFFDLYHNAPVGYFTLSENGQIQEANETGARMFGVHRNHLIKQPFSTFIHDEDQDQYYRSHHAVVTAKTHETCKVRIKKTEEKEVWVALEIMPRNAIDEVTTDELRVVITDITKRHEAQEKLEAATKERHELELQVQQKQKLESLGVMAGGIAHDFNNILFAILGNADLALDSMPPDAEERYFLTEIETVARRAAELTEQMLAYSGKGSWAMEKVDLSSLIAAMAHLLEASLPKKAVVEYQFEEALPAVLADPSQLRQIVMNLLANASEAFGEDSGRIVVKTGFTLASQAYLAETHSHEPLAAGRYVYLEVVDTGAGMTEEAQRRVFEPFFTTKFTGRGLGMAAVLGIARAHNGAINIETAPGKGTTIRFLLPALGERVLPPGEIKALDEHWKGHGTICLVDDEAQIRKMLTTTLTRKGFSVLTAADGLEAIKVFQAHRDEITCVLMDLTMPRMGGEECFIQLQGIRDDIPVILISGYSEEDLSECVKTMGFAGFIQKPVLHKELFEKIRTVLEI
jgi:PAS domain S-box-containing protein